MVGRITRPGPSAGAIAVAPARPAAEDACGRPTRPAGESACGRSRRGRTERPGRPPSGCRGAYLGGAPGVAGRRDGRREAPRPPRLPTSCLRARRARARRPGAPPRRRRTARRRPPGRRRRRRSRRRARPRRPRPACPPPSASRAASMLRALPWLTGTAVTTTRSAARISSRFSACASSPTGENGASTAIGRPSSRPGLFVGVEGVEDAGGDFVPGVHELAHHAGAGAAAADQVDAAAALAAQPRRERQIRASGVPVQVGAHAVHGVEDLGPQHLVGRPERRHLAVAQHQQLVEVVQRQVEVVQDAEHREPVRVQLLEQVEEPQLVRDVEGRRRLVEQQQRRLLHERLRQHHELLLAAGELREAAARELGDAETRQRPLGVVRTPPGPCRGSTRPSRRPRARRGRSRARSAAARARPRAPCPCAGSVRVGTPLPAPRPRPADGRRRSGRSAWTCRCRWGRRCRRTRRPRARTRCGAAPGRSS